MRKKTLIVLLALGLSMFFTGGAQAASTGTWGAWTMYGQERDSWCWAAATKSIIKKATGTTVSQCNIVKAGKNTTACANVGGSKSDYARAFSYYGVTPYTYTSGHPSWDHIRNLTLIGKGAIQGIKWTGTSTYHAFHSSGPRSMERRYTLLILGSTRSNENGPRTQTSSPEMPDLTQPSHQLMAGPTTRNSK